MQTDIEITADEWGVIAQVRDAMRQYWCTPEGAWARRSSRVYDVSQLPNRSSSGHLNWAGMPIPLRCDLEARIMDRLYEQVDERTRSVIDRLAEKLHWPRPGDLPALFGLLTPQDHVHQGALA